MALARWQNTIVDNSGLVQSAASVEVRRESDNVLMPLYTDRAGTVSAGNPVLSDADGYVYFHVIGGAYKITATKGAFSRVWRYVGVGLNSESDDTSAQPDILGVGIYAPHVSLQSGDLQIARTDGLSGALFFGITSSKFLYYNGTEFLFSGGGLNLTSYLSLTQTGSFRGIDQQQTLPLTGTSPDHTSGYDGHNVFRIVQDGLEMTGGSLGVSKGWTFTHEWGGANATAASAGNPTGQTGRIAMAVTAYQTGATTKVAGYQSSITEGMQIAAITTASAGGTGFGADTSGNVIGVNIVTALSGGAAFYRGIQGLEIGVGIDPGCSVDDRAGITVGCGGRPGNSDFDAAIGVIAQPAAGDSPPDPYGWKTVILLYDPLDDGFGCITETGYVMRAINQDTNTIGNGIDLTGFGTITNNAFASNGFEVKGTGALKNSQTDPTSGFTPLLGGFTVPFNLIDIETDNSTEQFTAGLGLRYVYGTGGDKVAFWIECGGYTPSAASENVGLVIEYHQTGGAGGASWIFGQNTYIKLETGCTGYTAMLGAEIDFEAQVGTSLDYKGGWAVVLGAADAVQGTTYDCGYALGSLTATSYLKTGFLIGNMHGHAPLGATSTIMATTGAKTIANGIDFSSYTFTGNAFASPNFTVTGAGVLTACDLSISSVGITSFSGIFPFGSLSATHYALAADTGATMSPPGTLSLFINRLSGGDIEFRENGAAPAQVVIRTGGALALINYMEMTEQTAPSAGAANTVRIYAEDNGAGKTRLMALFNTGAAQQIAIEPP